MDGDGFAVNSLMHVPTCSFFDVDLLAVEMRARVLYLYQIVCMCTSHVDLLSPDDLYVLDPYANSEYEGTSKRLPLSMPLATKLA